MAADCGKKIAFKGKRISNPVNGQSIEFITTGKDSDGQMLEMISTWQPTAYKPAPHFHPHQTEIFEVVEGELTIEMAGTTKRLRKGDTISIPASTVHRMWNESTSHAVAHWKVFPALRTEYFLETAMGLAENGKVGKNGMPDLLQFALLANKFQREFRLEKPAYLLQKILFHLLTPVARLRGKKAVYSEYLD